MTSEALGRPVILSGPSCVGKSPLYRALGKFHPELRQRLDKLVLFNTLRVRVNSTAWNIIFGRARKSRLFARTSDTRSWRCGVTSKPWIS